MNKKYAVIQLQGKQYIVSEGDRFVVPFLKNIDTDTFEVSDILLVRDNDDIQIGTPVVKNKKVKIKVIEHQKKGKKIQVRRFKAKSRYRKNKGYRPLLSLIKIVSIS